jgi:hypothetical protein
MKRLVSGLLLALALSTAAYAAGLSAYLGWTTPTQNTDGSTITTALTYNAYQGLQGQPLNKIAAGLTVNTLVVSTGLTAGTTQCFAVTALEGTAESAQSNQGCVAVPIPPPSKPNAPTGLTVVLK